MRKGLNEAKEIIASLYKDIEGCDLGLDEPKKVGEVVREKLVEKSEKEIEAEKRPEYKEIPLDILYDIIKECGCDKGTFYYLGSGNGEVVVATHMLSNFSKCIGIEIDENLHHCASQVKDEYIKMLDDDKRDEVELIHGDFLEQNFSDAGVVLIGIHPKSTTAVKKIEKKFEDLRSGIKIISMFGFLKDGGAKEIKCKKYTFPWGEDTVYFYEKQ
jgi:hypothetical protein